MSTAGTSTMFVLAVNTGSSSLKVTLYEEHELDRKISVSVDRIGLPGARLVIVASGKTTEHKIAARDHAGAAEEMFRHLPQLIRSRVRAIGHRIVQGGRGHAKPELFTPALLEELRELQHLDPTHMPQSLSIVESFVCGFPDVPQFACFDTAFHRSMPEVAQRYPLPRWTFDAGIRRYGFHGLSCESILSQLEEIDPFAVANKVLIAHLGNGASITAVRDGASVDTTMGFSPTGGIMMGTRCGDVDPTVITYLARTRAMTNDALEKLVNQQSGLLGVSGESQDMRDLVARAKSHAHATEAIELYCYIARKHFGALAAVLGGVDTIVFTGGLGEHAASIREKICSGLAHLGVQLDRQRNRANAPVISAEKSAVTVRVIATDEDLVIARHVQRMLGERSQSCSHSIPKSLALS